MIYNQSVAKTALPDEDAIVSTMFIGFDDLPGYFETMVFGGKFDRRQWHYKTYDEAVAGHNKVLELVRGTCEEEA